MAPSERHSVGSCADSKEGMCPECLEHINNHSFFRELVAASSGSPDEQDPNTTVGEKTMRVGKKQINERKPPEKRSVLDRISWATFCINVGMTIGLVLTLIGLTAHASFIMDPEYKKTVGGHITAAYWADTPELMIEELEKAKQGMVDLGLSESMYCDIRPWHQTPDCRMDYQYREIDSTIERAKEVIRWRDNHGSSGGGDQLGDVYGQKVDRIRQFIGEGCNEDIGTGCGLDEIAYGSFRTNFHFMQAVKHDMTALVFLGWLVLIAVPGGTAFAFWWYKG